MDLTQKGFVTISVDLVVVCQTLMQRDLETDAWDADCRGEAQIIGHSRREVLRELKASGWLTRKGGPILCPSCRAKANRGGISRKERNDGGQA